MNGVSNRASLVAAILESVTLLSSGIIGRRYVPFRGITLTRTQLEALHRLAHARAPFTPGGLASALGVTRGAVTQLVEGLKAEQLVQVAPNPDDARSSILSLTATAAAEVAAFEQGVIAAVQPLFADLEDRELQTLAGLLARVRDVDADHSRPAAIDSRLRRARPGGQVRTMKAAG